MFKKFIAVCALLALFATSVYAGTVTIAEAQYMNWGPRRICLGTIALSGAYSSTAFSFPATVVGMSKIDRIMFWPNSYSNAFDYMPYYVSGTDYILLGVPEANEFKPATAAASLGTSDSFNVLCKPLAASDADTSVMYVSTMGGSQNAFLGIIGASIAPSTAATNTDPLFCFADSATSVLVLGDSAMTYPSTKLRGKLTNADTVFFDHNASDRCSRLMYSGTGLGNMGDLYIPINYTASAAANNRNGRFIKIVKKTNAQIYAAGAVPLHFVHASTALDDTKLQADILYNSNISCGVLADSTYTSLPRFINRGAVVQTGRSISGTWQFIAIGE